MLRLLMVEIQILRRSVLKTMKNLEDQQVNENKENMSINELSQQVNSKMQITLDKLR